MFVPYECCTQHYTEHYQTGSGLPHYRGQLYQKGYGLGGFFRNLFRSAMPLFTKGLKTVGKEALRTGTLIASNVLSGENFKSAAKQRTKEAGKVLAQKAIRKAQSMVGSGKYKRKRKLVNPFISRSTKKRKARDIFGA